MFDKLLGKKEKGIKIFTIPEKKYTTDQKKISKMDKKDLIDLIEDMEKYIRNLTQKLETGKKQFEASLQKIDQVNEKHSIVSDEMSRINNQHQELSVKFSNLQNSLELLTQEKQQTLQAQIQFCQSKNILPRDKVKDLTKVLSIYHDQVTLSEKISAQNKQLKQKYSDLESEYYELSDKFNDQKTIMTTNDIENSPSEEQKNTQKTQKDQQKYTQLKSVLEGKEQMIISVNKQLSTEKARREEIAQQLKNMEEQISQYIETISKNEGIIEQQKQEIKIVSDQCSELRLNIKKLQGQMKDIQFQKKQQEENLKNFIQEIQSLNLKIEQITKENRRIEEEKNVILETNNMQLSDVGSTLITYTAEIEQLKKTLQEKQVQFQKIKGQIVSYEQQISKLNKLKSQFDKKNAQIECLNQKILQYEQRFRKIEENHKSIEEGYMIKLKKLQFELNSQKIKVESMKRSLGQLQGKDEENQQKLDQMYEYKMRQEGKMVHLQKKLKQYKHLIQYLKREKVEMEKTFQNKLKNFQEMVVMEPEDQDQCTPRETKDVKMASINQQNQYQAEITILQNKMVDMEETLGIVKMEGNQIRSKVNELELENTNLKNTIKLLNDKREEAMKEIKKLSAVKPLAPSSKALYQSVPSGEDSKAREKRIAEKAYRGFDILSKQLHPLYKEFLGIHIGDIEKPEVKSVETGINMLLKKTMDMKDIFQDYI